MTGISVPGFEVSAGVARLREFADAIGETRPLYLDEAAARQAGYRSLPLPPTFLFGLCLEAGEPFPWFAEVGFDLPRVLHAEQTFTYHRPACAGETLTVQARTTDVFERHGGILRFAVRETRISDAAGLPVADLRSVFVQPERSPPARPRTAEIADQDAAALRLPPIARDTLERFAIASGDLNPLHRDPAFARRAGLDDVIAQGMLAMAWLARRLTQLVPQSSLRQFSARFLGITRLGEAPVCRGHALPDAGDGLQRFALQVDSAGGEARLRGEALSTACAFPPDPLPPAGEGTC